ncbi:MAG: hypothetical protein CND29_00640 [Marine Group II euryarchaeote MED-G36]|nr:MAG: hypothetical protein CND29_00640 [Marine Group II euryarchaeote MED-G36]
MRIKFVAAILVTLLLVPSVTAHGADTFSFILRNSSIQPELATVQQNDTLVFYNVANQSRVLTIDLEGDGVNDWSCNVTESNSSSVDDECRLWLNPANWTGQELNVIVSQEGEEWGLISLKIMNDNHTENLPPSGYNLSGGQQQSEDIGIDSGTLLIGGAVLSIAAAAIIWNHRRVKEE